MGTSPHGRAHLFLVRVWTEDAGDGSGKVAWHGKVQRVVDGEARPFSGWQALVEVLRAMLPNK